MTPHKCPCCDGWGYRIVPPSGMGTDASLRQIPCVACNGTGIVWELTGDVNLKVTDFLGKANTSDKETVK